MLLSSALLLSCSFTLIGPGAVAVAKPAPGAHQLAKSAAKAKKTKKLRLAPLKSKVGPLSVTINMNLSARARVTARLKVGKKSQIVYKPRTHKARNSSFSFSRAKLNPGKKYRLTVTAQVKKKKVTRSVMITIPKLPVPPIPADPAATVTALQLRIDVLVTEYNASQAALAQAQADSKAQLDAEKLVRQQAESQLATSQAALLAAQADSAAKQADIDDLNLQLRDARADVDDLNDQLADANAATAAANVQRDAALVEVAALRAAMGAPAAALLAAQAELVNVRAENADLRIQLLAALRAVDDLNNELERLREDYAHARADADQALEAHRQAAELAQAAEAALADEQASGDQLRADVTELQRKLARAAAKLTRERRTAGDNLAAAQQDDARLTAENDELKRKVVTAEARANTAETERDRLQRDLAAALAENRSVIGAAEAARRDGGIQIRINNVNNNQAREVQEELRRVEAAAASAASAAERAGFEREIAELQRQLAASLRNVEDAQAKERAADAEARRLQTLGDRQQHQIDLLQFRLEESTDKARTQQTALDEALVRAGRSDRLGSELADVTAREQVLIAQLAALSENSERQRAEAADGHAAEADALKRAADAKLAESEHRNELRDVQVRLDAVRVESDRVELLARIDALTAQIDRAEQDTEEAQNEAAAAKTASHERAQTILDHEHEIQNLREDLDRRQQHAEQLVGDLRRADANNAELQEKLGIAESQRYTAKVKSSERKKEIATLKKQIVDLVAAASGNDSGLRKEVSDLRGELSRRATTQLAAEEAAKARARQAKEDLAAKDAEINRLNSALKAKDDQLQAALAQSNGKVGLVVEKQKQLDTANAAVREATDRANGAEQEAKKQAAVSERLKRDLTTRNTELERVRVELAATQSDRDDAHDEIAAQTERMRVLAALADDAEADRASLTAEHERRLAELENVARAYTDAQDQLVALTADNAALNEELRRRGILIEEEIAHQQARKIELAEKDAAARNESADVLSRQRDQQLVLDRLTGKLRDDSPQMRVARFQLEFGIVDTDKSLFKILKLQTLDPNSISNSAWLRSLGEGRTKALNEINGNGGLPLIGSAHLKQLVSFAFKVLENRDLAKWYYDNRMILPLEPDFVRQYLDGVRSFSGPIFRD